MQAFRKVYHEVLDFNLFIPLDSFRFFFGDAMFLFMSDVIYLLIIRHPCFFNDKLLLSSLSSYDLSTVLQVYLSNLHLRTELYVTSTTGNGSHRS